MFNFYKKSFIFISTFIACGIFSASAATMILVPEKQTVGLQEKIIIKILVDSEGKGFNVAQATIRFPKSLMTALKPNKASSVFSFWLEEPAISNDQGVISFIGGAPYGVSGKSIEILSLEFTPKGIGSGEVSIVDAAITSSDGSGVNIISGTSNTKINVSLSPIKTESIISPITQTPKIASGLPELPKINIPLYPDRTSWYNSLTPFTVTWSLSSDISGINTAINHTPDFVLKEESKGVYDDETFEPLRNGIQYFHIRFKNNVGWGPTFHYRLAIDTVPPVNFTVKQINSEDETCPTITLQFKTTDALSGLRGYVVIIDGKSEPMIPIEKFKGQIDTPPLLPGDHNIQVQAIDLADNVSISPNLSIHIKSIICPILSLNNQKIIYTDGSINLNVSGYAEPETIILANIYRSDVIVDSGTTSVNKDGGWTYSSKNTLPQGVYIVHIREKDKRGAISDEVLSSPITIKGMPIFQIGPLHFDLKETFTALFIILVIIITTLVYSYRMKLLIIIKNILKLVFHH